MWSGMIVAGMLVVVGCGTDIRWVSIDRVDASDTSAPVPHLAGSVRQLLGRDADATVTAWLLIDASGAGVLCDDLPPGATARSSPTMQVDWTAGGVAPPPTCPGAPTSQRVPVR